MFTLITMTNIATGRYKYARLRQAHMPEYRHQLKHIVHSAGRQQEALEEWLTQRWAATTPTEHGAEQTPQPIGSITVGKVQTQDTPQNRDPTRIYIGNSRRAKETHTHTPALTSPWKSTSVDANHEAICAACDDLNEDAWRALPQGEYITSLSLNPIIARWL